MRALLCLVLCAAYAHSLGLLAIDYGSDSFKASFIGPGIPFDVLYNKDSKRKSASLVALHGDDRLVGGDATPSLTRYPKDTFAAAKMTLNPATLGLHRKLFELNVIEGSGRSVVLQNSNGADWSPEEIIGMQFAYAKDMAKVAAKGDTQFDTVITVPSFFGQKQRQVILDAAELAGLRVMSLLNDGTAVGVNYAMTRTFPLQSEAELHLFYDVGASNTQVTIIQFYTIPPASITAKNTTQLVVKATSAAPSIGGFYIDAKLRDILHQDFEKHHGSKLKTALKQNPRAMAKLLKEASRVKQVLSANQEAVARIENLAEDVDFKTTISRQQLEEACAEMTPLLENALQEALVAAGIKADDLTSAISVGGSSRVPLVQAALKSIIPESKLAYNLNADEAAVMGAALQGASLSAQFKTKDIRAEENIAFTVTATSGSSQLTVFPAHSKFLTKNVLEFKEAANFSVTFTLASKANEETALFSVNVYGFESLSPNITDAELANSTVKVSVLLTESGIVNVDKIWFALPERSQSNSVADRIKNLFGAGKDKAEESASSVNDTEAQQNDASKPVVKEAENIALKFDVEHAEGYRPMILSEKSDAKKRLRDLEAAELRKKRREEARNGLEAYLYSVRDLLESSAFTEASTESERQKIRERQEQSTEWMWSEGDVAQTKDLRSHKSDLEKLVKVIQSRIDESKDRPAAAALLELALNAADAFHTAASANFTTEVAANESTRHTVEELTKLREQITKHKEWYLGAKAKQQVLALNLDPVLKKNDLNRRAKEIQQELDRLGKKKKPRKVYTPPSSSSTSTIPGESASGSASTSTAPAAEHTKDEL